MLQKARLDEIGRGRDSFRLLQSYEHQILVLCKLLLPEEKEPRDLAHIGFAYLNSQMRDFPDSVWLSCLWIVFPCWTQTSIWLAPSFADEQIWSVVSPCCLSNRKKVMEKLREKGRSREKKRYGFKSESDIENIKFIDALWCLNVSYHFKIDIIEQLGNLFENIDFNRLIQHDECDLYTLG